MTNPTPPNPSLNSLLQQAQEADQKGRYPEAAEKFRAALAIAPNHPETLASYGSTLKKLGKTAEGLQHLQHAAGLAPQHAAIQYNYGLALQENAQTEAAVQQYQKALQLQPQFSPARVNWAQILIQQGNPHEAEKALRESLRLDPTFVPGWLALGRLFGQTGRFQEASAILRHALELSPNLAEAWILLGVALHALQENIQAESAYRRGLALSSNPDGWLYYGNLLLETNRLSEASHALQQATQLAPQKAMAWSQRIQCALKRCDWQDLPHWITALRQAIQQGDAALPFEIISLPISPAEQKRNAIQWCQQRLGALASKEATDKSAFTRKDPANDRLKIAYLSADFRRHATADLLTELLERHDRTHFEVHGFSLNDDDQSPDRQRIVAACDHFHDACAESPIQTAENIRQNGIDILVDINVHTLGNRLLIPALRPAPLQLNYLGFPSTSGASFYDYLIADRFVVPPEETQHYTEKIAYLPHCYQPSDTKRVIAQSLSRTEYGLPESAFIFCCFNANWKWSPTNWSAWMDILSATPHSVLWLLTPDDPEAEARLRQKAQNHGIAPERIIFAPRCSGPENLARQSVADLFLDTLPYNAHTTANDALYVGLPVVTCVGNAFPGRVAGSLLTTLNLTEELVTSNWEEYRDKAIYWARNPSRLATLRQRIQTQKKDTPLFDMAQFTKDWEALLAKLYKSIFI